MASPQQPPAGGFSYTGGANVMPRTPVRSEQSSTQQQTQQQTQQPAQAQSTPTAAVGTSSVLLQRIQAQEASLRAMRQSHAQMVAGASNTATAPTSPAAATAQSTSQHPAPYAGSTTDSPAHAQQQQQQPKVFIPPLRIGSITPHAAPAPAASTSTTAAGAASASLQPQLSARSRARATLPQSNDSATYFDTSTDHESEEGEQALALIMRVRLDAGVQELAVPRGANAAQLAARFGAQHGLKPMQIQLLGLAITQHLELAEQYSSAASTAREQLSHRGPVAGPATTAPHQHAEGARPLTPSRYKAPSALELAAAQSAAAPASAGGAEEVPQPPPSEPEDSGSPHHSLSTTLALDRGKRESVQRRDHSRAFAPVHKDTVKAALPIPPYTPQFAQPEKARKPPSALEIAREIAAEQSALASSASEAPSGSENGSVGPGLGKRGLRRDLQPSRKITTSKSPARAPLRAGLTSPSNASTRGTNSPAPWPTLSNQTVSERNVIAGLKGAPNLVELERVLAEKELAEQRRQLAAAQARGEIGGETNRDEAVAPVPAVVASEPLAYHASFAAHQREKSAEYTAAERMRAELLEAQRAQNIYLATHKNMPFISLRSQEIARDREARLKKLQAAHEAAIARGEIDPDQPLDPTADSIRTRRARAAQAAEAAQERAILQASRMSKQSRRIVAETRANQGGFDYDAPADGSKKTVKRAASVPRNSGFQTERERDDALNCTFKPVLSPMTAFVRPQAPIWARGYALQSRQRATIEAELERRRQQELVEYSHHPVINPVSDQIATAKYHGIPPSPRRRRSRASSMGGDSLSAPGSRSASVERGGSVSPSPRSPIFAAGHLASERLYGEASIRRLKAAQRVVANDEVVIPFFPELSPGSAPLPDSPRSKVAQQRRQLQTLAFLQKHQRQLRLKPPEYGAPPEDSPLARKRAASLERSGEAAFLNTDFGSERRRIERSQTTELKKIHSSFLARNDEFLQRKQDLQARISQRFQNREGTYAYDPTSKAYVFQPFFTPRLEREAKQTNERILAAAGGYDASQVYLNKSQKHMQSQRRRLTSGGGGGTGSGANSGYNSASDEENYGRSPGASSGAGPSKHSALLLREKESHRIALLFLVLDGAGNGFVDASCRAQMDDIPSEQDRRVVARVFRAMEKRNQQLQISSSRRGSNASQASASAAAAAAAAAAASAANEEKQALAADLSPQASASTGAGTGSFFVHADGDGSSTSLTPYAPPQQQREVAPWQLDLVQFSAMFAREQRRLTQREGPQSEGRHSRAASGAGTPLRSGSRSATHSRSASIDRAGTSPLLSGQGRASASHSRSASIDRTGSGVSPRSSSSGGKFLHAGSGQGGRGTSSRSSSRHASLGGSGPAAEGSLAALAAAGSFDVSASGTHSREDSRGGSSSNPDLVFHPTVDRRSEQLAERNARRIMEMIAAEKAAAAAASSAATADGAEPFAVTQPRSQAKRASGGAGSQASTPDRESRSGSTAAASAAKVRSPTHQATPFTAAGFQLQQSASEGTGEQSGSAQMQAEPTSY